MKILKVKVGIDLLSGLKTTRKWGTAILESHAIMVGDREIERELKKQFQDLFPYQTVTHVELLDSIIQ